MSAPYAIGSDHFPGLSKLVEEMGELSEVLGKILGSGSIEHWTGNLEDKLVEEVADVYAALDYFLGACPFVTSRTREILARRHDKVNLFWRWHEEGDPLNKQEESLERAKARHPHQPTPMMNLPITHPDFGEEK